MHLLKALEAYLVEHSTGIVRVAGSVVANREITDLVTDSRQVTPGSIFIAIAGTQLHGNAYIDKALALGAAGVLSDQPVGDIKLSQWSSAFIWQISNLSQKLPRLSQWFYNNPSAQLELIGITGTNGKTSSAFYTAQLLSRLTAQPVGLIGTLGNGCVNVNPDLQVNLAPSANTTPDVVSLNRVLAGFVSQGLQRVVMEVSSHGLVLQRIARLVFNSVALTQVTRDHLDFHLTEDAYREAKQSFFTDYPTQHRILNLDDAVGLACVDQQNVVGYSLAGHPQALIQLKNVQLSLHGLRFQLSAAQQTFEIECGLMGHFNAENLACAISICVANGHGIQAIAQACQTVQPVAGRMETVRQNPWVLVDYAHTPDALDQALKAARQHLPSSPTESKLWVVFGCGGNRDQGKRRLMGRVAQTLADAVVLTDDNPRCEASFDILSDILEGFDAEHFVQPQLIPDRKTAIETALEQAAAHDLILIAGKGHEDYQLFCNEQMVFSDQATVREWQKP